MSKTKINKSVLFVGQAFYNHWYLSRELRKLNWKADLINILGEDENKDFFHGEDYSFSSDSFIIPAKRLRFYLDALCNYEVFHFANANGIYFINTYDNLIETKKKNWLYKPTHKFFIFIFNNIFKWRLGYIYRIATFIGSGRTHKLLLKFAHHLPERWDILLIKKIGKKIVYTNNGCLDGVLKSSFTKWSTPDNNPICSTICHYKDRNDICSDNLNKKWGEFRNSVSDYQCLLGGNRIDYNLSEKVHERPEVYALDKNFWSPNILIPSNYLLAIPNKTVKLYHAVGNFESRNQLGIKTIKSTHIYFEVLENLKNKGHDVEIIFFKDVPSKIIRYYQLQADIIVDMLSFGFFGANVREGMMLGKPCVCYLRPEWLEQMRAEIPEYVAELPVISATPQTIESILTDLIIHPEKRKEIGLKSRAFAEKWHSSDVAAKIFDKIYSNLLSI
jgi:glycosyltransferase involved in cell wall biosynthesis